MARTDRKTLKKVRMRVLAYLTDRAERAPGQGTPLGFMARELALTEGRVRSACRALTTEGLLVCEARFADDGGQKANVYLPTPAGCRALRQLEEEGSPCRG